MGSKVVWTLQALDDAEAIADYISRDSLYHARRVLEALADLGDTLGDQPRAGRIVPELDNPLVRERFLYSYRLIYEITEQQINVLAIIHGKRLLESVEQRFK